MKKGAWLTGAVIGLLGLSINANSEEFGDQALALCDKVKQCALAQMGTQELTPQMRQAVVPMIENMCSSMQAQFQLFPANHELYEPALACMTSMSALPCEALMEGAVETPQCEEYQALAKEYSD